ncbi:hypothetical protein AOC36_04010 [Erysipelothrix larvae]|uniref:Type II secretion system protein GspF domain-containing protein n=1 Tax=Erysipelothrix larvae TaxID=1514105 RepID=A0A0X8GZM1_9FIRM|nr:type II secretion system F family protein [Erysipelothrix larvae]AMC93164.1 hypothetical protein AOC36_04010 [Erysipelothrix larvae]
MPSYKVTMITPNGETITDVLPVDNVNQLLSLVKQRGNYCADYELVESFSKNHFRLKLSALVVFCYQMSAMLNAGVPLIEALKMIQSKTRKPKERNIYSNLYEEVQKGNALSVAMLRQEGVFDPLLISMIQSGEQSGSLGEILETMSRQYDRDKRVKSKLRSASIYPVVLLVVSIAVVVILVVFVLPGITSSFPESAMPALTRVLLGISHFMINRWYVVLMIVLALGGGTYLMIRNKETRLKIDQSILRIPIAGELMKTIYSARVARSFASLYKHGIPALKMIDLTSRVIGNTYLEKQFEQVYVEVSRGELISNSIEAIQEFDSMLPTMIRVGEETGDLEGILSKIANYFDEESEAAMTRLVGLVEPMMIIILGIMVAIIVIAIMQPIFTMYQYVQ